MVGVCGVDFLDQNCQVGVVEAGETKTYLDPNIPHLLDDFADNSGVVGAFSHEDEVRAVAVDEDASLNVTLSS